ncbi:MAG: twin-arginine translocase TatA/TatE family subunit [Ignavibacteriales bacterium]|jgi:sec-independent protein translocase protein TatA|nr:twin-arginine translocase TatA/TatE family subunit [Ignavibacteriales bacterium]
MFGNIGATEIILILLVVLVLFGAKKIPELAQGLGKGMKEFKRAVSDVQQDVSVDDDKSSKSSASETRTSEKTSSEKKEKANSQS